MADSPDRKPLVVITGAAGAIGTAIARALGHAYTVVGLDIATQGAVCPCYEVDLTSADSIELALRKLGEEYGDEIASVIHLAAYFDFTGEEHPLYEKLNVAGSRKLLDALQAFTVGQFVYSGTMLVHRPAEPGGRIDEDAPIEPKWAYPISKARAEAAIRENRGDIPAVLLHLAGLYDDRTAVPTLSHQIARVYERDLKSHVYAGDLRAGQSLIHVDDLVDAVRRTVERRGDLPEETTILVGEPDPPSYADLQARIGRLIHGDEDWTTLTVPESVARLGAWLETEGEPLIPDAIDQGEKPFIRPFMVEMASDHYALDISRARDHIGWAPRHNIRDHLPELVAALKRDPAGWYAANGITPPDWLSNAAEKTDAPAGPERLRHNHRRDYLRTHRMTLWGGFLNMAVGAWLIAAPTTMAYQSTAMAVSDLVAGALLLALGFVSLSAAHGWARWAAAAVGVWLMFAPLAFWVPTAAAYANGTLAGALAIGFAVLIPPTPGVDPVAARTGPTIPPGWEFTPSSWFQRLPIIILAVVGLLISRHMAAYQLGHVETAWEPLFAGTRPGLNGTEDIVTSTVSEAWPVPDAGLGAMTYMLEFLTGVIGSSRRWRTMPWLVMLFGLMIVPLGAVSITFIIIQPIVIGTWCTLCLIAAAAMLIQIPYSLDELVATTQFLIRRKKAGRPLLRVFFTGDTDDGDWKPVHDDFRQPPGRVVGQMLSGGVGVPWNLALCVAIGVWLMFTRLTLGADGGLADAEHLIGALVITVTVTAFAEVARPLRLLNAGFGVALIVVALVHAAGSLLLAADIACGLALIVLSIRRGEITTPYGGWNKGLF
ncbi:MAG: vitamin K epoxide reductase family protein [Azospirillaceae bacterium]